MEKSRVYAIFAVTFAVVAWGSSFIATKVALRDVSPVTVVWLRFFMGVLILGMAVVWRRQIALAYAVQPRQIMSRFYYFL